MSVPSTVEPQEIAFALSCVPSSAVPLTIVTPASGVSYAMTTPLTIGLLLTVSVAAAVFPVRQGQAARTVRKKALS